MPRRASKRTKLSQINSATHDETDRYSAFTTWAKEQGVEIGEVRAAKLPGRGVGLICTSRIKKDQRILFVPEKAMLKPDNEVLRQAKMERASPQAQLAATLLVKSQSPGSPLSIWRATWPTPLDFEQTMPMRWSASLRELLPPSVPQPLQRQREDYSKDLKSILGYLNSHGWSVNDFVYYWSIVNSRSFHWKPPKGRAGAMVMCPYIDYMNHAPTGSSCQVFQRDDGYEVLADRDYASDKSHEGPGEELLATYGSHTNDKLLVHYGFILPSNPAHPNPDDDIRLDHILFPKLSEDVRGQLQDVGFLGPYALLPASNELCFKTQVAVRAMLLTSNEWEYFVANGEDLGEDYSDAVNQFMKPLLMQYRSEAREKLEVIVQRISINGESPALSLMRMRWQQIVDAVDNFLSV